MTQTKYIQFLGTEHLLGPVIAWNDDNRFKQEFSQCTKLIETIKQGDRYSIKVLKSIIHRSSIQKELCILFMGDINDFLKFDGLDPQQRGIALDKIIEEMSGSKELKVDNEDIRLRLKKGVEEIKWQDQVIDFLKEWKHNFSGSSNFLTQYSSEPKKPTVTEIETSSNVVIKQKFIVYDLNGDFFCEYKMIWTRNDTKFIYTHEKPNNGTDRVFRHISTVGGKMTQDEAFLQFQSMRSSAIETPPLPSSNPSYF